MTWYYSIQLLCHYSVLFIGDDDDDDDKWWWRVLIMVWHYSLFHWYLFYSILLVMTLFNRQHYWPPWRHYYSTSSIVVVILALWLRWWWWWYYCYSVVIRWWRWSTAVGDDCWKYSSWALFVLTFRHILFGMVMICIHSSVILIFSVFGNIPLIDKRERWKTWA